MASRLPGIDDATLQAPELTVADRSRPRTAEGARGLLKPLTAAAALVLLSQGLFWLGLGFAESKARPDTGATPAGVTMQLADAEGRPLPDEDPVQVPLMPEPGYVYADPDRHPGAVFSYRFDAAAGDEDLGLYLGWSRRIVEVRLNGMPLKTQTPADIWGILGGFEPVIYSLPAEYLRAGANTIEILNSGRSRKILPVFHVGDLGALFNAHNWGRLFSVDLVLAAIGVMVLVALLCLLIHWPADERVRVRALVLLLGAWTVRNLTFLGVDGGLPDPLRLLFHFFVTFVFLFAFVVFALGWTRRPAWTFRAAAIALAIATAVSAATGVFSEQALFRTAFAIETAATLLAGGLVIALFVDYWIRHGRHETVETLLFLVCITAVVADAVDDRWQIAVPFLPDLPLTFYAAPMCGLLLALGMCASLAAQSTRARIAIMTVNETLAEKLAEQERQLAASHEREKAVVQERALADERKRIIRDMHDGVGGNVMSLLLKARRESLANEELVGALEATVKDLRLIIDSMDSVGDNLAFALGVFRQRTEPGLKSAGAELGWEVDVADEITGFGPRSVLNIYRVLQEACNNAVVHGGAREVAVRVEEAAGGREIAITVEDDGSGFDCRADTHGRGLGNMRRRARELGGELTVESGGDRPGTRVTLRFPRR